MKKGDILEVIGLSVTFASDIQEWCERSKKKFTFYLNSEIIP
jgi:TusA-related sulfurtransferase